MENLYAIHAYEGYFQGLHGIENRDVVECECDNEAYEIATEMSRDVINDYYTSIPNINDLIGEDEDVLEEAIEEDIDYTVYKLTVPTNASLDELYNHFNNDPEEFLKQYGAEAI